MEKLLPVWLVSILEEIALENGFANFALQTGEGCKKGDNFVGVVISVELSGKREEGPGVSDILVDDKLNLVCKLSPTNEARRKQFNVDAAFERESLFYNEIAPMFLQFQRERGLGEDEMFSAFPKCFRAIHDQEQQISVVILEDLRPTGFRMWPKNRVNTAENLRLIVRELAKFHAVSFAMKAQLPNQMAKYERLEDPFRELSKSEIFISMHKKEFGRLISMLSESEHKTVYKEMMKDIHAYYSSCSDESVPKKYRVIGHGDCWNNNILFKFDESEVASEISLIDWQMIRFVSPTMDLLYNIFTSTDRKLRASEYGSLIRVYHDQLSTNIRQMGSDPDQLYPFQQFLNEFKLCGNIAFLSSPGIISICLAGSDDIVDLNEFSEKNGAELVKQLDFRSEFDYKQRIAGVVADLFDLGYFRKINI